MMITQEKIDIVEYSDDVVEYIANALRPAKVLKVLYDEDSRSCLVVVNDDQLSLAIGKEGQNVRLAAKLTNWKIDIRSFSGFKESIETGEIYLGDDFDLYEEFGMERESEEEETTD